MRVFFSILRKAFIGIAILVVVTVTVFAAYLEYSLPSVEMLKDMRLQVPLKVFSSDGKLMAEFGEARRTVITLNQVPKELISAIIATEDPRFYAHAGVDIRGLMRATVHLLTSVSMQQGGSTITMQVARNYFLHPKKTFIRKISEILLALKIEKEFTKDEILELYLNKIYFGKRAYGVAAAAEVYFGTTVEKLTLDQIAMIAGLPQAPSSINPFYDRQAAYKRRKHVLERMLSLGYISQEEFDQAVDVPLPTRYHSRSIELDAPYIAEMVRQELFDRFGEAIYTLGYEVTTTIDSQKQAAANNALWRALLEYDQRHGYRNKNRIYLKMPRGKNAEDIKEHLLEQLDEIPAYANLIPGVVRQADGSKVSLLLQDGRQVQMGSQGYSWARTGFKVGEVIYVYENWDKSGWRFAQIPQAAAALVALAPEDGAILSLVGGFDYNLSNFNRVAQAERQPGSSFKPFIYAAALNDGYTLSSIFNDAPITFVDPVTGHSWSPKNASGRSYGPTRLRVALYKSQNLVTVRVLQAVGVSNAIEYLEKFGFDRAKMPPVLPLALGAASFTPLQMASAYATFANGGNRVTPYLIKSIRDYQGNLIEDIKPPQPVPAINPQIAYLITSALHDTIEKGTAQRAKVLGRQDLSGKTGTTNDWLDAWFSGYNRDIVATAWVGFDEPRSLREYGSVAALPMWIYFMQDVLKTMPEHPPLMPPGVVTVKIDPSSGRIASHGQSNAVYELYTENTVPGERGHSQHDFMWEWEHGNANEPESLF